MVSILNYFNLFKKEDIRIKIKENDQIRQLKYMELKIQISEKEIKVKV